VVVSQIKKSNTNLAFQDSDILFEDNHLIIVNKPCGLLVQGDKTGDVPLLEVIRKYIKDKYDKRVMYFLVL
jgi:23S rRNA pseudouridine1911/1915/1917 synthase